jgi:hypothetical protein
MKASSKSSQPLMLPAGKLLRQVRAEPTSIRGEYRTHSFKNRTGPPVEPEKTGTGDPIGLLSALDRSGF